MRVLVTGATGYIGSAVVDALEAGGHEPVGLARSDHAAERLRDRGVEVVRGDLKSPASLEEPARSVDAVIHAAATGDADAATADEAAVLRILAALEGTDKPFVYTSGVWVLGNTGEIVADEDFSGTPIEMVRWRVGVERRVLDASGRDIRTTVVRPAIVYGDGGGILAMLVQEARETGRVRVVEDGRQVWPVVHLDDLADLYVRLLDARGGRLYHAAAGPSYALRDLALAAGLAAGDGADVVEWPLGDARQEQGGFAEALALDQRVSGRKAREELGWSPVGATPLEELILGSYAS